ncbi:Mur ligase [Variovorax sp. J22G40]|uniref:Mur ligase n=1 Tax=Variovorax sp. J22G40 TaxID=3053505 RepID=UPI002577D2D6|nr:Mur ligase [Variovorax sp. J22G40]MDM0087716.1 Mur ligase [Variovorax sp. J22G40]
MIAFRERLRACRDHLLSHCAPLPAPYPAYVFFFSATDGQQRAHVVHAGGPDFTTAWQRGVELLQQWIDTQEPGALWLRVDWVEGARAVSWERLTHQLALTKRNYFRYGIAFDEDFECAFTEQELNANAMLYGGSGIEHAVVNRGNFGIYHRTRFGPAPMPELPPAGQVYLLSTRGVFCQPDGVPHAIEGAGLNAGRRVVDRLDSERVLALVRSGSSFLAQQVRDNGAFVYGHFPCFDRRIPTYNTLRHASSVYAMLEAWELTRDDALRDAIEVAIEHVAKELVRQYTLPDGQEVAFLIDTADEIKLGGNAVCLLAMVKYCELMDSDRWLPLLEKLALGIASLQDPQTGRFNHVLHAGDLSLKQASRIIYYDGEAAFGLLRLYALTRDGRWLAVVEKAFGYFIANEHWRAHDHWLSYCVNELTRWRPLEVYFRFGLLNVADHLDFVLERKTTFPTLLELMLAAEQMLRRLRAMPTMRHLLDDFDTAKFYRALEHRAHYLLNGFFWPEMAMYFKKPAAINGSFFIRHQAFRVRIDDVEHYLSGFVAYHRFLLQTPIVESVVPMSKQDLSRVTIQ